MLDIVLDALLDALKTLPFLFGAYLLIEYLEHRSGNALTDKLRRIGPLGPLVGALFGAVPQCGFSVTAANLYAGRLITVGTLIAVFISTSDEAVLILLAHPEALSSVLPLILTKIVIAFLTGFLTDLIFRSTKHEEEAPFEDICKNCHCDEHSIWVSALIHTARIFAFLFAVNLVLGLLFYYVDTETVGRFLLSGNFFQPFLTALLGFIPNCAASVILTELYLSGTLSFGSVIAGLSTGAGLGMAVLFRTGKPKHNIAILAILYLSAVISGVVLNLIF